MAPEPGELGALAVPFLERQPWFLAETQDVAASDRAPRLVDSEVVLDGRPGLASLIVNSGERAFHLLVGWRDAADVPALLGARHGAVLGVAHDDDGEVVCYDALADDELALELLRVASSSGQSAARVRVVQSLASHASLVFDERLFMKCYRVLEPSPRPEVELLWKLDGAGFNYLLGPVARWERRGYDLALVREYVAGAVEGRALALTSLRDLLGRGEVDPRLRAEVAETAGGDLASEMRRLGEMTGHLHLALADAFGTLSLRGTTDARPGLQIRVHGDFHLRRVMRTDAGWILAGFGDDPLISRAASGASSSPLASPLEDLADLTYSLREVADEAVAARPATAFGAARRLGDGWVARNAGSFLDGYLSVSAIEELVPGDRSTVATVLEGLVASRVARGRPYPARG